MNMCHTNTQSIITILVKLHNMNINKMFASHDYVLIFFFMILHCILSSTAFFGCGIYQRKLSIQSKLFINFLQNDRQNVKVRAFAEVLQQLKMIK